MSIILKGILALFWLLLVPAAIGILVMSKRKDICPEACPATPTVSAIPES